MTPENFPKVFAAAFAAQDSAALAALLAEDVQMVTLTGALAETSIEAKRLFDQEFGGTFATTRIVTGRNQLRLLGPGGAIVHQRFVVIGARDEHGTEIARFGAMLTAVLLARADGWRAVSLSFSVLTQ